MNIPAISAGVVGLFLILQGITAIRSKHYADGIADGAPAFVLGLLSLGFGLVVLAGAIYYTMTYRGT